MLHKLEIDQLQSFRVVFSYPPPPQLNLKESKTKLCWCMGDLLFWDGFSYHRHWSFILP